MSLSPPAPTNQPLIQPYYREFLGYYPSPIQAQANWQKELAQIPPQAGLL